MSLWHTSWGPMLLGKAPKPFDSEEYIFEMKFDGIRAILFVDKNEVKIKSRNNRDLTSLFPELQSISKIVTQKVIFDGEIVAMQENKPSFNKLQNRLHLKSQEKIEHLSKIDPVVFVGFDILYESKDLINLTLLERKKLLNKYPDTKNFIKSMVIDKKGKELFRSIKRFDLEGIVAKKKDSKYEVSKRSDAWLKIKNFKKGKFYIGGYTLQKGKEGISLLLGEYKNKLLYYVGKVSVSSKRSIFNEVMKEEKIKISPFNDFKEKGVIYIKPKLNVVVNYIEKTGSNHLREPFLP